MSLHEYIKKSLISLGLSEGEVAAYLVLLKKPALSVYELTKKTGMSFAGTYKILDSLQEKKLAEHVGEVRPFRFKTTDLSNLAGKIQKKAKRWQRMSRHIHLLSSTVDISEETEIFSDTKMADFYLDLLQQVPDFLFFSGTYDSILHILGKDLEYAFVKDRVRRGIPTSGIMFEHSLLTDELEKRNWREKREFRYFDILNYPREFTYVYGDHVASFFQDENDKSHVVHTQSPQLARARLVQMQALWNSTCK